MAEFKLEKFKYNWRGDWVSGRAYKRDDIVRLNGKSYVCLVTHVSSSTFRTDLLAILMGSNPPQPQPKWVVMTSGKVFVGNWVPGTNYNLGDIVNYNGSLWTCEISHTSTNFSANFSNWSIFANTVHFVGNWTSNETYSPGSVVKYNGILYKCITNHISGISLEASAANWEEYFVGVEIRGDWAPNTLYRKNDIVYYGGTVFRCLELHTSNATNLDDTKFQVEIYGSQYDGLWNPSTYYNIGDIVRHEGFVYYAVNNNRNSKPFIDNDIGSDDWILLSRSYNFVGEWSVDAQYKTGDVVLRGGNVYQALRDINGNDQDGSSTDYLDDSTWELLIPGKSWKGLWVIGNTYSVGDVVYYLGSAYTCNFEHISDVQNFPGDNGNFYKYWDILIERGAPAGLQTKGDLLTYGKSRFITEDGSTLTFDGSSLGVTNIPIGEQSQVLSVSQELEAYWRDIVVDADVVFVSTSGIDADGRGTAELPFASIAFACEYVEDTFPAGTPVIIRVSTGRFNETGPIIVPAGCAVNGDELRSTTVVATGPRPEYQNDFPFVQSYLTRLESIILSVIRGIPITKTPGNPLTQITTTNYVPTPEKPEFPVSDVATSGVLVDRIEDYINYINFKIGAGGSNVPVTGSNQLGNEFRIRAADAIQLNKEFLQEELLAYLKSVYPNVSFNELKVKKDINSLLRGLKRDVTYASGNYGTMVAARRYANNVVGSKLDNLFLMRDSTGLRDLTVEGLTGTLNPPGVFELYQKPTGGACVSLDPGWGPNDDRVWITTRSPYIQNVTNIGTACVGKKVDGALHNGGNRSMVSNDFTQVLSDGIGVWVTNNGRTELVSVFTYYCQIGYFAEDGGIIRATNGNNSYGAYGAIADGEDTTEVPQQVTIFNRNNEAQVIEAIAGGATDEIYLFEYGNAGEEYSQADATVIGAGANADVTYSDFRDGALFEARLTFDPADSGTKGGAGYTVRQGPAQETIGASSTIKLSANDVTLDIAEIFGMRILITGGTGIGQYGYVDDFNFVTKEVTVRRESDDELGWDHIIPGTPIESNLDLTTTYRIEPRIKVQHPGFSSSSYDLFINRTYVDLEYGDTSQTFNNITGLATIQWLDDNSDPVSVKEVISPVAMQFNASFATNPSVPFTVKGLTSGTEATITAITARTETYIEVDVTGPVANFVEGEELNINLIAGTGETFDGEPITAIFNIARLGTTYNVTLANPGSGYAVNDTIKILGSVLGGATPDNDLIIKVTGVSNDSTNSIQTFTTTGSGRLGRFVALTNAEYARWSNDGQSWTEVPLSFIGDYRALAAGNFRFIALANNTNRVSSSLTGQTWTDVNLPKIASWSDITYGGGRFVIIADDTNDTLVSTNGTTWTVGNIPDDTVGDSTISQWSKVIYGKGKYLAVSANDRATATSSNGITWTRHDSALPDLTPDPDWSIVSVSYGDNRFIVLDSAGRCAYSFDGITWYRGTDAPGAVTWKNMKYGNGVFFAIGFDAVGTGPNATCATTEDGLYWFERTLSNAHRWNALTNARINNTTNTWVVMANAATTGAVNHVLTGKRAKCRANVLEGRFENIKIWDPGSGYSTGNLPILTITDPNFTNEISTESRIGKGVLGQPDFINRGSGYRSSTSTITITGNGYADIIPEGNELTIAGVSSIPGPGVQIRIAGILEPFTEEDPNDLKVYSGVEVTDLGDDGSGNGTRLVRFLISPRIKTEDRVLHATSATLREKYSQCRITGHDFLDVGTGNFIDTNYPEIYAGGRYFVALPENEVYELNGGRVYYTSTDQDGNFRTGELFAVQQSTGIVTISAQFFDLDGLSELALGGVRLGGSGTVVNEFSTDPTFIADSNNVIPTQRAIATFLANRLSVGGENIEVNRFIAGRIGVGGFDKTISNVTGEYLQVPVTVKFEGTYTDENEVTKQVDVQGTIVSQILFLASNDPTMQ